VFRKVVGLVIAMLFPVVPFLALIESEWASERSVEPYRVVGQ